MASCTIASEATATDFHFRVLVSAGFGDLRGGDVRHLVEVFTTAADVLGICDGGCRQSRLSYLQGQIRSCATHCAGETWQCSDQIACEQTCSAATTVNGCRESQNREGSERDRELGITDCFVVEFLKR